MRAVADPVPVFSALGEPTRWAILCEVGQHSQSASALADRLPVTRQAIAKHLAVLESVGLVEHERHGRELRYRSVGSRLDRLARDLEHVGRSWDERLSRLADLAEDR